MLNELNVLCYGVFINILWLGIMMIIIVILFIFLKKVKFGIGEI